jgi:AMP phosphorylase
MLLRAVPLQFQADKPIVILSEADAQELDVRPLDRIEMSFKERRFVGIVNTSRSFSQGVIGLYEPVSAALRVREGDRIGVGRSEPPASIKYIKKKLNNVDLEEEEIRQIIKDVTAQRLSDIEMTAFVIGLHVHGLGIGEAKALSESMAATGEQLILGKKALFDKHSVGGCPGDKTTIVLVPIMVAAGLTMPKTSSRSITSPAGTADRVECLCPVDLSIPEIRRVVKKTGGCLVWGGAVNLAPADDMFIKIEYPLSIDPLLLPSVMSKKKAVGARYVVIDIPTGRGAKVKTTGEAQELGYNFIRLGREMGIRVNCVSTFGEQPIGYGIGPALEAREALATISMHAHRTPWDLMGKVFHLANHLFDFKGIRNGEDKALHIWRSGKAEKKLRQIIEAQGGDPKIKPSDIPVGSRKVSVASAKSGQVLWISNGELIQIARGAGAPKDKGAGIMLHKKLNSGVKRGEPLFEIYAEKTYKLNRALELAKSLEPFGVGDRKGMVYTDIPKEKHERYFILER